MSRGRSATRSGLDADGGPYRVDLAQLIGAFGDLPNDPYALEENRFRRYARAVYLPWDDTLSWIPDETDSVYGAVYEFHQPLHADYDQDYGRKWPSITPEIPDNALLLHLMRGDVRRTLRQEGYQRNPLYLSIHLIKLAVSTPGDVAVASPNCIHRDGTPFVFAHLIGRRNVVGGENLIAQATCAGRQPDEVPSTDVHAVFALAEPLESYAVCDTTVSHHVAPVRHGGGAGPGERRMILIGVGAYDHMQLASAPGT